MMRQFLGNEDFIWNCNYDFKDRFGGQDEYFNAKGTLWEDEAFLDKPFSVAGLLEAVSLLLYGRVCPTRRSA